ncbi:hypothetical protein QOZ80_3AG0234470 [Eleusine coracana subsp. coracana]|nr:hypothetical protein QOZ80_3AG0234470 [Eleusine coracana subsp. coracana]
MASQLSSLEWPVETVRETFFSYFGENQHAQLSSTPVIPVDDPEVPLIHTCLKRFKGTLNGRGRQRTCFSLSWSYGDYFKKEAIDLTFTLLSKKYKLPQSKIYATYFSGDISSSLSSDNESKNTLQKYIGAERIVPSMSKADFWMAGETGPCGPCIGFFFDCSDNHDSVGSVRDITDGKFVEICRLVFVEFDRQADGVLGPLQAKHVLTGINLECLSAILQNKESHYDLDVYTDVISDIFSSSGKGIMYYSGKVGAADTDGVDTAYRLLADHMRMIAVINAPGSQLGLGNEGREYFLKCADKQAVQYGHKVLKTDEEKYDLVIDGILKYEPGLCTELEETIIERIEKDEVMIYRKTKVELRDQEKPFHMGKKKKMNKALCNVLLLGGKITLDIDIKKVSEGHLIHLVQRHLLYGNTQMQLEQNLELSEFNKQVLGLLPKLPDSLYFDVTFASSYGFVPTSETALFGFLGVPLHHGWLVDPQDVELGSPMPRSSYSKLSYTLAIYESIRSSTNSRPEKHGRYEDDKFYSALAFFSTESEEELASTSCAMISTFLRGPQLTPYGFSSLRDDLKARQPTVLIWNEKLITISKFEDKIYVLLNDLSLLTTETNAVWERLTQENGDGLFVDCNFMPTDLEIQSTLPLKKNERKKKNEKEKLGLNRKKKEEDRNKDEDGEKDRNEDGDGEKTEAKDDEKTEEKDDGNAAPQNCFLQGSGSNLNIRPINFFGRSTHVIHQINDGPCALIAICNVLLLKGDIFFEPHETVVSMDYLLDLVYSFLKGSVKMQAYCDERQREILDVAKTLATGFDVDVIFTRTNGFTRTLEWLLLDCLDLNPRHGWIAAEDLLLGPEESFESLTLASNEPDFQHVETIKKFLNGPQLTPIGLVSLQKDLDENVPCILYWNHHYSTIVKINGVLHSLVTDSSYLRTSVVWQTLHEVNGGGIYMDSNFTPIYMGLDAAPSGSYFVPETSTSEASTSFMKPNSEGITSHGDGLYLDCSLTQVCSGPDAALLEDPKLERQQEAEVPFDRLSELDLLTSSYLEDELPVVLENLLCSDHQMTAELWEWLKEVLEDYTRPEPDVVIWDTVVVVMLGLLDTVVVVMLGLLDTMVVVMLGLLDTMVVVRLGLLDTVVEVAPVISDTIIVVVSVVSECNGRTVVITATGELS